MKRMHGRQAAHHAFRQLPPRDSGSLTIRVQCVQISSQTKQRKSIHDGGTNDLEHDCFSRPSRGKERQSPPLYPCQLSCRLGFSPTEIEDRNRRDGDPGFSLPRHDRSQVPALWRHQTRSPPTTRQFKRLQVNLTPFLPPFCQPPFAAAPWLPRGDFTWRCRLGLQDFCIASAAGRSPSCAKRLHFW